MLKSMDGPVYRGVVPPGVDLLGHANRLGINLRSGHLLGQNMGVSGHYYGSLSSQYHTTAEGYGSPAYHLGTFNRPMMKKNRHSQSSRIDVATTAALISHQRAAHQGSPEGRLGSAQGRLGSAQGRLGSAHIHLGSAQPGSRRSGRPSATPTYIRNVVVPLQTYNESVTVEQSYPATQPTVKAYHSVRAKSAEARPDTESHFPARPPNSRVQSAYSDRSGHRRPQSSTPLEQNHGNSNHGNQGSSQSLRFEMERERQDQSRVRKRSSQVSGHRVDQQYYMTGNNFRLRARYQVEDEELRRLKELSSARTQAAHYGRGLSKYKYYGLPIHEHFMAPTDLNLRECSTGRPMESDKSSGVITVVAELPSGQEAAENETSVAPDANQTEISAKEKSSEKDRMSPDRMELLDTYQLTDQNATHDPSIDQKASTRPTGILAEAAALRSPKLLHDLSRTLHQLPLTRSVEPRGQRCVSPGGLTPAVWGPGGNSPGRSSPGVHSYIPPRSPDVTHGLRLVPNHDEGSNNHDLPWRSASPQIERWPPMLTVMDLDHSGLDSTAEKR